MQDMPLVDHRELKGEGEGTVGIVALDTVLDALPAGEPRVRGGLLHTDPQERAKTTTASSDCRPRPTAPDPVVSYSKHATEKHQSESMNLSVYVYEPI